LFKHLSDDLNNLQTEMMDKISDVQQLKLVLNGLRTDQGDGLDIDLEQVTIELKLDEVVRQHIIKPESKSITEPQEYDIVNEGTFEQAPAELTSSSGMKVNFLFLPLSLHFHPHFLLVFVFKTSLGDWLFYVHTVVDDYSFTFYC